MSTYITKKSEKKPEYIKKLTKEEKEKKRLYQSDVCPLYFNHFNLINTQNETA